jgi:two-component system OmpR family sensor kinase
VTLRARVAAAAAAAIVLAVALLVIAVPEFLARELQGTLDDALRRRATDVAQLNATAPNQLTAPGALEGRLAGSALFVQVVDRSGRIVVRSSGLGGRILQEDATVRRALRDRQAGFGDGALGTDPLRVYAAPLGELGRGAAAGGAVIVAGSTGEIERTLDRTRTLVVLSALAAAALAAGLATLLTRRALRPLTRLSSGARAIGRSGDVSERLPSSGVHDEVGELAGTLNAMLASLERAREAEHRFVGDASHELRTPLTALRGNAAFIARHGPDPAVLADIEAGAARLSELLDDLLALAREDAAAPARGEPVALEELARAAGADGVQIERPVTVDGERAALERALDNLVRNARKHGTGRVTVTVGGDDGWAFVRVQDEGPGIPAAEADQAFERFWRGAGARGEGSGLGLAIVRAIAERHGGRVEVDGARFTLFVKELSRSPRTTGS